MVRGIAVLFALILSSASLAQGFDYDYRVYEGDNNQDGNLDFYVRKTSLILLHGDIVTPIEVQLDGFLLQQNPDGTFAVLSNIPFAHSGWTESAVDIGIQDFNLDGVRDLMLDGIEDIHIFMDDLIVIASPSEGSPPVHVTNIDDTFKQFYTEISGWTQDANYFENNAPTINQVTTVNDTIYHAEWCAGSDWVAENGPLENLASPGTFVGDTLDDIYSERSTFLSWCSSTGRTVIHYDYLSVQYETVIGQKDYSGFNPQAIGIIADLEAITDPSGLWDIIPGSGEAIRISDILEDVLGTTIFGGVLKAGGLLDIEITLGIPNSQLDTDRGERIRVGLITTSVETDTGPPQRPLTLSEIALAVENGMVIRGVHRTKVVRGGLGGFDNRVASKRGHIYIPDNNSSQLQWSGDYGQINPLIDHWSRATFVHELVHVHQYFNRFEISQGSSGSYCYKPTVNPDYYSYDREQRAEMVKDRFIMRLANSIYESAVLPCNKPVSLSSLETLVKF